MAESLLRHWGEGEFVAYSAGSFPKGEVHPLTLEILQRLKLPTAGLRSKSWDEYSGSDAPVFDFVITVCDNARDEVCPVWPGQPMTAHWGVADPVAARGSERDRMYAFRRALLELENRIKVFVNLPLRSLDRIRIQDHLQRIGNIHLIPTE